MGLKEIRPWGGFLVLEDAPRHKVKRVWVDTGRRLSYQRHQRRSEHWVIIQGRAMVTLDGKEIELSPGQSIDIPCGAAHRITNPGEGSLVFIEIQTGDYFEEDDIVRLEDDFGRT
jgi:mannose-6-phosphate isomerase-like protein (cupin superfamily)